MKLFLSLLVFCFCSFQKNISAQSWQPIKLTVSGNNVIDSVEAFFQLTNCYGKDVVFIKFVNQNTSRVVVQWQDAVFTKELKWINREHSPEVKSVTLESHSEITGDCGGKEIVVVPLNNFIANVNEFKLYGVNQFAVKRQM